MLYALLICTDGDCAIYYEASGTPEELEAQACEFCGCTLQAVSWSETSLNGTGSTSVHLQLLDAA